MPDFNRLKPKKMTGDRIGRESLLGTKCFLRTNCLVIVS